MDCLTSCIFCGGVYTDNNFYIFSECFLKIQRHTKTHSQNSSAALLLFSLALIFQAALIIPKWVEGLKGQKLIFLRRSSNVTLDLLLTGDFVGLACLQRWLMCILWVDCYSFCMLLVVMKKLTIISFFRCEKYPPCVSKICPTCLLRKW